jgi:transposase
VELARYLVDAVVVEKRSCREVARAHGVSKSWVAKLVARYREGGYDAIAPRSKAATKVANRSSVDLEDRVVRLRKQLAEDGFDAGAQTIHYHLSRTDPSPPSVSTIWRILKRRGLRHAPTTQATEELLHPFRGAAAQRDVAIRRHRLRAHRLRSAP